jgi:arginyl-tRNA synthetase
LVEQYHAAWLEAPLERFVGIGMEQQLEEIRAVLHRFGLVFDRWSSQQWLRTSGRIEQALEALKAHDALYEAEDALWFASSRYGDDKDRVVRKRDGELTYLAPDIAYHQWKTQQGYEQIINLWGPDHHGYVPRIKAAMAALGASPDRLKVRIVQLVTLSRHGKPVPMSKRQGEFVTFREILDEVGIDATRFFFLMRTMESHLEFDLELAKSQSQENPVYYIQYAHARICSIFAKQRLPWWIRLRPDLSLLQEPEERLLMRWLFQYPIVLRICAASLEPHGVTAYLRKLAESFHVFYTKHRVITDDARRSSARLALIQATRQIFANGLGILGIRAPQSM